MRSVHYITSVWILTHRFAHRKSAALQFNGVCVDFAAFYRAARYFQLIGTINFIGSYFTVCNRKNAFPLGFRIHGHIYTANALKFAASYFDVFVTVIKHGVAVCDRYGGDIIY